jgi:drug/metabolite transporter, DME family
MKIGARRPPAHRRPLIDYLSPMHAPDEGRRMAAAYGQVLLAGALWGTSGPFSVALYRLGIPPTSVAFLRTALGALFLALLLAPRGRQAFRVSRREALFFVGFGGSVVGVFQLAYQLSTDAVGVPATVALLYLAPAWVVAVSAVLLNERLTPVRGGLALVSVAGVWMTVFGARGVDLVLTPKGILWGCLTGIAYGTYAMFGKVAGRARGALVPLFWSTAGGTVVLAGFFAAGSDTFVLPSDAGTWALALVFGFLTMAAAPFLLFHALRTLEAGRAAIGTTIEPLVAAVLAVLLLDQTLTPGGWTGLVILMLGVIGAYAAGPASRSGNSRVTSAPPPS